MEARKVQKVGASSLSISLPKNWADAHQIERGDVLFWDQAADNALLLLPPELARASRDRRHLVYHIHTDSVAGEVDILSKLVVGNYVLGRNTIIFHSKKGFSNAMVREIHLTTRRLMGISIVEEDKHEVKLQCAVNTEQYSLNQLVKRLFKVIKRMFLSSLEALRSLDREIAMSVLEMEDEVDRLYWLLLRLILTAQADHTLAEKIGIRGTLELIGDRTLVKYLEQVGDHAESIAKEVLNLASESDLSSLEKRLYRRIESLGTSVLSLLEEAVMAVINRDLVLANHAINYRREIKQKEVMLNAELAGSFSKHTPEVAPVLRAIAWNITWMGEYGTSIAEIAINRYLEYPSRLCRPEEVQNARVT